MTRFLHDTDIARLTAIRDSSPMFTRPEAAVWLRFCAPDADPEELARASDAVARLISSGRLRGTRVGNAHKVSLGALETFVAENQTGRDDGETENGGTP